MSSPQGPYRIAALYRFAVVSDCEAVRARLQKLCEAGEVRGTLLVAREGLNGTIAGPQAGVEAVVAAIRAMPGFNLKPWEARIRAVAERLLPAMKAVAPECDIVLRQTGNVPPFGAEAGSEVVTLCQKLAGQNEVFAVPYGTEAGLFQMGGVPAVVCGPGDIAQAHTANEWLEIGELDKCMGFLERLKNWASA